MRYFQACHVSGSHRIVPLVLPTPLSYHRIRLQWCASVLRRLARQWLIYLVIGLALLGAFSPGAGTSMAAMLAWSVLALFQAASQGLGAGLLTAALHSLVGGVLILALRPVLWPARWAETERALPLTRRDLRVSDAAVVALALLPLWVVYTVGAAAWLAPPPQWLRGHEAAAVWMTFVSMALSQLLGMLVLQSMRRPARQARPDDGATAVRHGWLPLPRRQHPGWALLYWPMLRGPARRTGRWLLGLTLVLLLLELVMARGRWRVAGVDGASWCLAVWCLVSLAGSSRLQALIQRELAPLHEASVSLPLSAGQLLWWRRGLGLLPLLVGLCMLPLAWWFSAAAIKPLVAGLFWLVSLLGHAWQWGGQAPAATPQNQVVRWILTLVLMVALASEVFVA